MILGDIQRATNLAVLATEQGTRDVQAGSEMVSRTAQTISELEKVVAQSAHAAQQIVAGVEQQTIGLDQIAIGISDINQAAQQSSVGAAESQKAAQDLNELAAQLKATTVKYKLAKQTASTTTNSIETFKKAHLNWVARVDRLLAGDETIQTSELTSHTTCARQVVSRTGQAGLGRSGRVQSNRSTASRGSRAIAEHRHSRWSGRRGNRPSRLRRAQTRLEASGGSA